MSFYLLELATLDSVERRVKRHKGDSKFETKLQNFERRRKVA